jgi:hypothetical protein
MLIARENGEPPMKVEKLPDWDGICRFFKMPPFPVDEMSKVVGLGKLPGAESGLYYGSFQVLHFNVSTSLP